MKGIICQRVLFLLLVLAPIFATVACSQMIAYGLDSQIWGMDVKTRKIFMLINPSGVSPDRVGAPSWSSDGKTIAAVIKGNIWLADVPSRKRHILIRANNKPFIGTPAWSKDGKFLYVGRCKNDITGSDEGLWQIYIKNGQSNRLIQPEDSDFPIHEYLIVSADGHYLISSEMMDGGASFFAIDLRSNKPIKIPNQQLFRYVTCYTFDKSSKILFLGIETDALSPIGKGPGGVWGWDLTTNKCTPWILQGESIGDISFSPNEKNIIIRIPRLENEGWKDYLYVYSITAKKMSKIRVSGSISHIQWIDNETYVAENAPKGDIKQTNIIRYNIRTGKSNILVKGGYGVAVASLRPH
jgi:Tol biopolymer transport system component